MFQAYIKNLIAIVLLSVFTSITTAATAADKDLFNEGKDYVRLPDDVRNSPEVAQLLVKDPNKVQVLFFFSYGCHACEVFHTPFEKWSAERSKKSNHNLAIYSFPVAFNPQWEMLAKLYFTMETLDPKGSLNKTIFDAIHKQGLKLWQQSEMLKFFEKHGYKAQDFNAAFTSFSVKRQVKQAIELGTAYKVTETPDIIVNGPVHSYRVSVAATAGDTQKLFRVLDYLVQRETKLLTH